MNSNDLIHNLREKGILNFNHISKTLTEDDKAMLIKYYAYYHRFAYVNRKCFKLHRNIYIAQNIANGLLACSGIISLFTALIVVIASAIAIINTGINEGIGFKTKAEKCEAAFKCFQEILDDITSYLRGNEFNLNNLIASYTSKPKS